MLCCTLQLIMYIIDGGGERLMVTATPTNALCPHV